MDGVIADPLREACFQAGLHGLFVKQPSCGKGMGSRLLLGTQHPLLTKALCLQVFLADSKIYLLSIVGPQLSSFLFVCFFSRANEVRMSLVCGRNVGNLQTCVICLIR